MDTHYNIITGLDYMISIWITCFLIHTIQVIKEELKGFSFFFAWIEKR